MQKIKLLIIAIAGALMTVSLSAPVFAASASIMETPESSGEPTVNVKVEAMGEMIGTIPYPTDIQLAEQGELSYLYKPYTAAANCDPNSLIEAPFTQGGYHYKYSEIIQREHIPESNAKAVSEDKTVESDSGEQANILTLMGNKLPYTDNEGYTGDMFLVPESLRITETGRTDYSYIITDVREYPNLDRNDPSYVPNTVQKNGVVLTLQDISWNATSTVGMGYSEIPSKYTAIATYAAPAKGSKASGYMATATFAGEAIKELAGKNIYTIVYEGEQIVVPFNYIPLIIAGLIIVGCIVACVILWRLRKNVTVYVYQQGVPVLYRKERIKIQTPILKLTQLDNVQIRLVFNKKLAAALNDQMLFVIGRYHNLRFPSDGNGIQDFWLTGNNVDAANTQTEEEV